MSSVRVVWNGISLASAPPDRATGVPSTVRASRDRLCNRLLMETTLSPMRADSSTLALAAPSENALLEQIEVRAVQPDGAFGERYAEGLGRSLAGEVVAPGQRSEDHREERRLAEAVDAGDNGNTLREGPVDPAAGRVAREHFVVRNPQSGEDG